MHVWSEHIHPALETIGSDCCEAHEQIRPSLGTELQSLQSHFLVAMCVILLLPCSHNSHRRVFRTAQGPMAGCVLLLKACPEQFRRALCYLYALNGAVRPPSVVGQFASRPLRAIMYDG